MDLQIHNVIGWCWWFVASIAQLPLEAGEKITLLDIKENTPTHEFEKNGSPVQRQVASVGHCEQIHELVITQLLKRHRCTFWCDSYQTPISEHTTEDQARVLNHI
jgi:hypothetical protein